MKISCERKDIVTSSESLLLRDLISSGKVVRWLLSSIVCKSGIRRRFILFVILLSLIFSLHLRKSLSSSSAARKLSYSWY